MGGRQHVSARSAPMPQSKCGRLTQRAYRCGAGKVRSAPSHGGTAPDFSRPCFRAAFRNDKREIFSVEIDLGLESDKRCVLEARKPPAVSLHHSARHDIDSEPRCFDVSSLVAPSKRPTQRHEVEEKWPPAQSEAGQAAC